MDPLPQPTVTPAAPAPEAPALQPTPVATVMPTAPIAPPTPAPVMPPPVVQTPPRITPAPAYIDDTPSPIKYYVLAVLLLILGLALGAGGGYYYAILEQPAQTSQSLEVQNNSPVPQESNAVDATTNTQTDTSANPLDGVKTNPFE